MPNRILIVEDDKYIVETLRDLLEIKGYHVFHAYNGQEGYERMEAVKPAAIILDIMMPIVDGLEFLARMRKDASYSHLPVIMLTAKHTDENRLEGFKMGADHYITKPFNHEELITVLSNLLERRQDIVNKTLQSPEDIFVDSKDSVFLSQLHDYIMKNIRNDKINLGNIAKEMNYSPSSIQKKVKRLTNKSVSQFVREFRLEYAKQLIEQEAASIKEIAFLSGFHSHAYFSRCFREYYGTTPTEVSSDGTNEEES